jgi:hypothetical protein
MRWMTRARYCTMIKISIFLYCGLVSAPAAFAMTEMADREMEQVYGQDGITIGIKNVQIFSFIDNYSYYAPANNFGTVSILSLQNIKLVNSYGGPALYNYDFGTLPLHLTKNGAIFLDAGVCDVASEEDWSSSSVTTIKKSYMGVYAPYWQQDVGYLIGNIMLGPLDDVKDLGWAYIGSFDLRSFSYYVAPHGDGIDFQYNQELHIDHFKYGYNTTTCDILSLSGIHMGKTFGFGDGNDKPEDPSTWFDAPIGEFKIGDLFGDAANNKHSNPARFDVAVLGDCFDDPSEANHLATVFNLPIQGSIRFDQAEFGGIDFGPGAIDEINAHRLEVLLIP